MLFTWKLKKAMSDLSILMLRVDNKCSTEKFMKLTLICQIPQVFL